MGKIALYNQAEECHTSTDNNFYIGKGSVLYTPFIYNGRRTNLDKCTFRTKKECMDAYSRYFDICFSKNKDFQLMVMVIFNKYKKGEDIYLQTDEYDYGHGEVLVDKIKQMLIKDKLLELKKKNV